MSDKLVPPPEDSPTPKRKRGRPKGSRNKVSKFAQNFCRRLTQDPEYRKKLKADFAKRKVPPQVEAMIWSYGHGKPIEQVTHNHDGEQGPPAFVLVVDGKALTPGDGGNG